MSAICFNLDQFKILSSGNGLSLFHNNSQFIHVHLGFQLYQDWVLLHLAQDDMVLAESKMVYFINFLL